VTCAYRLDLLNRYWARNLAQLTSGDQYLVIIDLEPRPEVLEVARQLEAAGVDCVVNGQNLGLSAARNRALDLCKHAFILFVDDEVSLAPNAMDTLRRAFAGGAHIVGARIEGPETALKWPWFITEGQFHYLAIHTDRTLRTWGACMGLDLRFVRRHALRFRQDLSRRAGNLLAADDTTFLREMRENGAREVFLKDVHVNHNIDPRRATLSYMLRRAYWQGRAEQRRGNVWNAMRKEWHRGWCPQVPIGRRLGLSMLYAAAVACGVARELLDAG
jgi:glycosyltransferase involved in cell wall biosynthesis